MSYEALRVELDDVGILTVALSRPAQRNAINGVMHEELERVWPEISQRADVKAVLLTGDGDYFSAGGDAHAILAGDYDPFTRNVFTHARRLILGLLEVEVPIVAAVNGDAVGLGANLALFCDAVFMDRSARIGDPHVRFGVAAGDGGAVIWPILCGVARAKEYLMNGSLLSASEADRVGLVNHVVDEGTAVESARGYLLELLQRPPLAVRYTKYAINKSVREQVNLTLDTAMALECVTLLSEDQEESVRAFLEKRTPKFKGR